MGIHKRYLIFIILLTLIFSVGSVCANDLEDVNITSTDNALSMGEIATPLSDSGYDENDDVSQSFQESSLGEGVIVVNDWDELQQYCSLKDKNYVLKLKENTNYYPTNPSDSSSQIVVNNNVTIIGSDGAYIGDDSPQARMIKYAAIIVPEKSGLGITLQGVNFKWIYSCYSSDGVFMVLAGNANNLIKDCTFTNITTDMGHSSIIHVKIGGATMENCTFVNCTTDFGCISVYNPADDPTGTCTGASLAISDSYFEGNYAKTEPGCINNCGVLIVDNCTFYKNAAFWWAGAIHTHGGGNTTIYDSNFTDNVAGWNGGALYTYSYLQIYNTVFVGNNCTTNNGGGAIGACKYLHAPYIYIDGCLFEDNENLCWDLDELSTSGTGRGGAISLMDEGSLDVYNSTFIKNSASRGTAICAISGGLSYGSPDVRIVGNRFINHTRSGDVLDVRLSIGSVCDIRDNYYYNNSIQYSKLKLSADDPVDGNVTVHIDASLTNPKSYDSDIIGKSAYDVYVDGVYKTTIVGNVFTLPIEKGETSLVYVIPCISTSKSNEVLIGLPKEYIYVSQNHGNDNNDGSSREGPVKTLTKAIELARSKGYIVLIDGTFNEKNMVVDYNLTLIGEGNSAISSSGNIFQINNSDMNFINVTFRSNKQLSSTKERLISQINSGFLTFENCNFIKNEYKSLIDTKNPLVLDNCKFIGNTATLIQAESCTISSSLFEGNKAIATNFNSLIKGYSNSVRLTIFNSTFKSNTVTQGCVAFESTTNSNYAKITYTLFENNTVGGNSQRASSIFISGGTLTIDSSIFVNNRDTGSYASLIYLQNGVINIKNSIIVNNTYENSKGIISGTNSALKQLTCSFNWWGDTVENYTVAPDLPSSVVCDNWLFLNISSNATNLGLSQSALIGFNLNNIVYKNESTDFYIGDLPEFDLKVTANNGVTNTDTAHMINGESRVTFTLDTLDTALVKGAFYGAGVSLDINASKVTPEIIISCDDVTFGDNASITITMPKNITESITLKINNNESSFTLTDGQYTKILENLTVGLYNIEVTYAGNYMYFNNTATSSFEVNQRVPTIDINVEDTFIDKNVEIVVTLPDKTTGDVTIFIGDINQTQTLTNGVARFTLSPLAADTYNVIARYGGDDNNMACDNNANFTINKYNSTMTISVGDIELGKDVILTFNLDSDANGNITVEVNGENDITYVTDGQAFYTIYSVSRGDYNIKATYNGSDKYLTSESSTSFEVDKLNSTFDVDVDSIEYGQDAVFEVTLAGDATGNVTVIVDGKNKTVKLENGKANITISGLNAGNKMAQVIYSGDNNYINANKTCSFNIEKVESDFDVSLSNIKIGASEVIQITITKSMTGNFTIAIGDRTKTVLINRYGRVGSWTLSDLDVDNYEVNVTYNGDNNYLTSQKTFKFNVSDYNAPQWPMDGYYSNNTGKSPYVSDANGKILWYIESGEFNGNIAIDSDGNIYFADDHAIYSYDNEGNLNWKYESWGTDLFSGIAIGRDVIISPRSGDTLYFVNQTSGLKYGHSNIYQGSSIFVPILDSNYNIYITSEYQYDVGGYALVIIPYSSWENGGERKTIAIGKSKPTTAPVIINDNLVCMGTEEGLKIIDISSQTVINSISDIVTTVRPIVDSQGTIYCLLENSLVALNTNTRIWQTSINGSAGNYIALDEEEGYIYSVNKQGCLFKYDIIDEGRETLVYDFNEEFSSGILIGGDSNMYLGSGCGIFYALNSQGDLLWKVNTSYAITGVPIMDKYGVIYTKTSDGVILAIGEGNLIDAEIDVNVTDVYVGNDVVINITGNSDATGKISVNVDGKDYDADLINGKAIITIPNLGTGNYSYELEYSGDLRFNSGTYPISFKVKKYSSKLNVSCDDVYVGQDVVVCVSLPSNATGNVRVFGGDINVTEQLVEGKVNITIPNLAVGVYDLTVKYLGDEKYSDASENIHVTVSEIPKKDTTITITEISDYLNIKGVLKDIDGNPISSVAIKCTINGDKSFYVNTNDKGEFIAAVSDDSFIKFEFNGDDSYNPSSTNITIEKIKPVRKATKIVATGQKLTRPAVDFYAGERGDYFYITLTEADGVTPVANKVVKFGLNGIVYKYTTDKNGKVGIQINFFQANTYTFAISFLGDDDYNASFTVYKLVITKKTSSITPKKTSYTFKANAKTKNVEATLKTSNKYLKEGKTVKLTINGKTYSAKAGKNGAIKFNIGSLTKKGTYKVQIKFAGDETYKASNSKTITIKIN